MLNFTCVHSVINPYITELNNEQFIIAFIGIFKKPGVVMKFKIYFESERKI